MDSGLIAAYRSTDYRVRLAQGGFASIHVDAPLPDAYELLSTKLALPRPHQALVLRERLLARLDE